MDVIKTSLIIAIAITSYYLLMQWPQDSNVQLSENGEDMLYSTINESEYLQTNPESLKDNKPSLSAMSSPGEAVIKEPVGVIFRVENEDLVLEIDSSNGRIFRSMFKGIKDELGSENPLVLLGAQNNSSYFASSGFFDEAKNSYIYPNFSEMSSAPNRDGSITYTTVSYTHLTLPTKA